MRRLRFTGPVAKEYRDLGVFQPGDMRDLEDEVADALLAWGEPFEETGPMSPEEGSESDGSS